MCSCTALTVVIAPGEEKLAWSDTIAWGEAGTATKTSVPGQAPTPTGAGRGGIYDPANPEAPEHRQEDIEPGQR